jgi:putative transposase
MKRSRFTKAAIIAILHEQIAGKPIADICGKYKISNATFHCWKQKYNGVKKENMDKVIVLEEELAFYKKRFAVLNYEHQVLKEFVKKKL